MTRLSSSFARSFSRRRRHYTCTDNGSGQSVRSALAGRWGSRLSINAVVGESTQDCPERLSPVQLALHVGA